jgi:hypothetical protein
MLDNEMVKRIQEMAARTWDVIGGDVLTILEQEGEVPVMSKADVIETVSDADYMLTHGDDKEAYQIWKELDFDEQFKVLKGAFTYARYGW